MNPLELSGPAFLDFFFVAGLGVVAATAVLRYLVARTPRRGAPADVAGKLHPTEIAFLLADLDRAVEAAIAGLHHRGLIEIGAAGTLRRTGDPDGELASDGVFRGMVRPARRPSVEAFVLARLPATVRELCDEARRSHLAAELSEKLEREELLVGGSAAPWLTRLPAIAWLALGVMKALVGLDRGRPIGGLVVMLVFGGVWLVRHARPPRLTRLGRAVERELKGAAALQVTAQTAPQQLSDTELSLAYAIFGYAAAPAAVMLVMPSYHAALASAASGGGDGGSSCGSSCGSGCGGGCGGCS
jgi:uncharacterized protein (TIGR04222 family)